LPKKMPLSDPIAEANPKQYSRVVVLKNTVEAEFRSSRSGPLPTDAAGQLHVPRHDGHPLGVDGAQVGVWAMGGPEMISDGMNERGGPSRRNHSLRL